MNLEDDLHDPTDGEQLLDDLYRLVSAYCVLPSRECTDAVVLWIATTHCLPAFDYATRLIVRSAEKRSGKSRLLEIIDGCCHHPLRAVNATVAAIFRSLDGERPPTLLLDEADTIFGSKKVAEQNEDLRGLLNAGYQRGLPVLRTVGPQHVPTEFATFAMAALAGIGRMPDTIEDRAVVVTMRRRKPSEAVTPFRLRRDKPHLERMNERLDAWASTILDDLGQADPDLPVEDRAADTWAPLVAVADAAGGHWPHRARAAAVRLTQDAEDEDAQESLNILLLSDIRSIFDQCGSFLKSAELCQRLHDIEESPWAQFELTPSKLGHRLREYGIKTAHNSARTQRGYRLQDFTDAFDRYLAGKPSEGVQGVQIPYNTRSDGLIGTDIFDGPDALKVSEEFKASERFPSSEGIRTPLDAFGRGDGSNGDHLESETPTSTCRRCGKPSRTPTCVDCSISAADTERGRHEADGAALRAKYLGGDAA